jgi:uncharacterized protein
MTQKIDRDVHRFKQIVKRRIKDNLKEFISHGEMIGRQGNDKVSIPIPNLDIPHFRYGKKGNGGVSSGPGEPGTTLGPGEGDEGREAGNSPGEHVVEVEVSLAEVMDLLHEELALPRIEPKGAPNIVRDHERYTTIATTGPRALVHRKRTFKRALKRQSMANWESASPAAVVPIPEDHRYRAPKQRPQPEANAVVFFLMDVSGSMGDEQKELVRINSFWIDSYIRQYYKGTENCYIIHDAEAREVSQDAFFRTRESGGTRISSAYRLCSQLMESRFSPSEWNIYVFHFSDGDNWGEDDAPTLQLVGQKLLPVVNLFGYTQVQSAYGSGRFLGELVAAFPQHEKLVTTEIAKRGDILGSIKKLLGTGR